jgi:hypothetical protein
LFPTAASHRLWRALGKLRDDFGDTGSASTCRRGGLAGQAVEPRSFVMMSWCLGSRVRCKSWRARISLASGRAVDHDAHRRRVSRPWLLRALRRRRTGENAPRQPRFTGTQSGLANAGHWAPLLCAQFFARWGTGIVLSAESEGNSADKESYKW